MEFGLWERYYKEILDDFGFSRDDDEYSAKVLDEILSEEGCLTLDDLGQIVNFSDKYIKTPLYSYTFDFTQIKLSSYIDFDVRLFFFNIFFK